MKRKETPVVVLILMSARMLKLELLESMVRAMVHLVLAWPCNNNLISMNCFRRKHRVA